MTRIHNQKFRKGVGTALGKRPPLGSYVRISCPTDYNRGELTSLLIEWHSF
jgi:hypothetical protein